MSKSIEDLAFLSQFILEPIFLGKEGISSQASNIINTTPSTTEKPQEKTVEKAIVTEKPNIISSIPVNFLGINKSQILVLGFYPQEEYISNGGLALFEKMYKALNLDLQDFAIVNVAKIQSKEFQLPEFQKLLVLGDQAAQLLTTPSLAQLPLKAKNIVVANNSKKLLWANTFEEIGQMDNVGKKAFWDALRELLG